MRRAYGVAVSGIVCLLLAGCGGGVQQVQPRRNTPSITGGYGYSGATAAVETRPAKEVQVVEANYYGHRALKMTNGIVTIVAVPDLGGRIMEYKIGSKPLLWVNLAEVQRAGGRAPAQPQPGERAWHNYGGYKVWPAPQDRWGGPPDPPGSRLDGGAWVGRIVKPRGEVGQIELTSPADTAVTGLQIIRRVTMYTKTTHVRVEETFKNVSDREVQWSIWTIAQVPGSLSPEEKFSEDARIFFPLNPKSCFTGGYRSIIDRPSDQWRTIDGGIMEVSYKHELGKIGADSTGGWIAYVDDRHDFAFVQRFQVQPDAQYPDGGCTVEVFTSDKLAYMEVEVLSPLHKIASGEQVSFATDWYATRVPGPIRDVTDVVAVSEPVRVNAEGKALVLSGTFGVYAPGAVKIRLLDASGKPTGQAVEKAVSPTQVVSLKQALDASPKAPDTVEVELESGGQSVPIATVKVSGRGKQG